MKKILVVCLLLCALALGSGCAIAPIVPLMYAAEAAASYDIAKNKPKMNEDLARFLNRDPNTYQKLPPKVKEGTMSEVK